MYGDRMSTTQWPISFDDLVIGDKVEAEPISAFCGLDPSEPGYRIKGQLPLLAMVRRLRPDLAPYVRCLGYGLLIMTPSEAAKHQAQQSHSALRRVATAHSFNMQVDVSQLTDTEQSAHERSLTRQGRYLSAISTVRKDLKLEARKSSKPKLSG